MTYSFRPKLVLWLLLVIAFTGFITSEATSDEPVMPYLFIRLITASSVQMLTSNGYAIVKNNQPIRLEVCIQVKSVADRFEQLEIQALNQHPDYFKHRPPPNIVLSVKRLEGAKNSRDVPFRINSSGSGKNLTNYYVNADIDILEDKTIRHSKAEQFVDWTISQSSEPAQRRLLQQLKGNSVKYLEEIYVNNPPGDYEVTAKYTPSTRENWEGSLKSMPIRLHVIDAGDFYESLKKNSR